MERWGVFREAFSDEFDFGVGFRFSEIGFNEFEAVVFQMGGDVGLLECSRVEGVEVIDADDGVAVGEKTVEGVGADESGAAGEEDFHDRGFFLGFGADFLLRRFCSKFVERFGMDR